MKERLFGSNSPDVVLTRNNFGKLLTEMRRSREAILLLERAVAILAVH